MENLKQATVVARNSLFILIGLVILKGFGGYITNIIVLVADAFGSFSDLIATSGMYVGLKLSQQKASKTFKYGYHRVETFISLLMSIIILYAGYRILRESFERFYVVAETESHGIGILAALISIVLSLYGFRYLRKTGESVNSRAMLASAYDNRNNALISVAVLVGIVADKLKVPYVEGSIGIIIALLIVWTGLKYGKDALFYLLDYWDNPEMTKKIRSLLLKSKIVTAVKNIRLRHMGTYIFGEAFLEINPFAESKDIRDQIHRLDQKVEEDIPHLGDLVLYIDPPKPTLVRVAIPIIRDNGLHSEIAENSDLPFHFLFVEIREGAIREYYSLSDTYSTNQISEMVKFLKAHRINILISSMIRPLFYYLLRLNNIKVYPHFLGVKDVENTVKLLLLDI